MSAPFFCVSYSSIKLNLVIKRGEPETVKSTDSPSRFIQNVLALDESAYMQ